MNAPADLHLLRQRYQHDRQALLDSATQRLLHGVAPLLRQLAQLTDKLLLQLWRAQGLHKQPLALVAVGGFGRRELFPYSDVDVLVLLPDRAGDALTEQAATFIRACWDAGLQTGSSVRTVVQCLQAAASDTTVQTALMERRRITGDDALYQQLGQACGAAMHPYAFYRAKLLEMRQRHAHFGHTPYALEPDCKESPGGLRDLQTVAWVAQAAGYGRTWTELHQHELMTTFELRQIRRHHALLRQIRWYLHQLAQRREDRLLFDLQNEVAEQPGMLPRLAERDGRLRPGERLMRRYYAAAKGVTQLVQILLLDIAERLRDSGHSLRHDPSIIPLSGAGPHQASNPVAHTASAHTDYLAALRPRTLRPINPRFLENNGLIEVTSDTLYLEQPRAILETFLLHQQTGLRGLSARTLRALYNARAVMNGAFRTDPANRRQFMQILRAEHGVTRALRLMNQTSVLGYYLPPFRKIVGQMQHDLFHVYTVDQHILMVARNIRRFFDPEHVHEYPLCSQLAAGWKEPWVLVTAALFHDIAKGRGGDHSLLGEQEVRLFARQHDIGQEDTELLAFLVREHLSLSHCAQKEDFTDPAVIAPFVRLMGDERRLTALYLLTVADIRGTNPRIWSNWKARLLEELYRTTLHALGGHLPDQDELVQARSSGALIELARNATPHAGYMQLWQTLDASYFLRHDASTIAWHTQHLAHHAGRDSTIVKARMASHGDGLEVLVYTRDRPALFARICGYFAKAGFSILDARIHTTTDGHALDTFLVISPRMAGQYGVSITPIETALKQVLDAGGPLPEWRRGHLSRRARSFPLEPHVQIDPEEKNDRWRLTVHASDRPGLLYRIARILARHNINVQLAKVSTMGERVEDSFLIEGDELHIARKRLLVEQDLFDVLAAE
ncbi:MAG: [protein-PII] uridylyltransferase [Brachymonas sp.]